MNHDWTVLDVLAIASVIPFALYVVANLLPRRRNAAGWAVLLLTATAALALSMPVFRQLTGHPTPAGYRLVVFALIVVSGWWLFLTFVRVSWRKNREAHERWVREREETEGGTRGQ